MPCCTIACTCKCCILACNAASPLATP
jgi:hypothetical protein